MQELRSVVFGEAKIDVTLENNEILRARVTVKNRAVDMPKEDLRALYEWLLSLFAKPVDQVIPMVKGDDKLAERKATSKYENGKGQTNLASLGLQVFDRSQVLPEKEPG